MFGFKNSCSLLDQISKIFKGIFLINAYYKLQANISLTNGMDYLPLKTYKYPDLLTPILFSLI